MKILVTGRDGQVARSLAERAAADPDVELTFAARPSVDLVKSGSLAAAIDASAADVIINTAAYTLVDRAEAEEDEARRINADAAGEGADAAARIGARFIQLSTDYVFDGSPGRAWQEDDPVAPINAYGRSKAEGERRVLEASPAHLVIRTSWVVSPFGHNFVRTMLRLAAERDELSVVDDQRGCPTSALDLADALLGVAKLSAAGKARGIYHLAGEGEASWADLAEAVMRVSADRGGPGAIILRIATADYPTPATRPANSTLDCEKAKAELGIALPPWRPAIETIVARLIKAP